jgi:hypothetical protein
MKRFAAILALLILAACATAPKVVLTNEQVVGKYDFGDGIGFAETLEIRADGTFVRTLFAHLGGQDVLRQGTWSVAGDTISFQEVPQTQSTSALTTARAEMFQGALALIPSQHDGPKVSDWFVYKKRRDRE